MTHPAYILVDAEGKFLAVNTNKKELKELAERRTKYKYVFTVLSGEANYKLPLLILPAEVKWEMPKDQQI